MSSGDSPLYISLQTTWQNVSETHRLAFGATSENAFLLSKNNVIFITKQFLVIDF